MEQQKFAAAKARNFLDANKLSKEIKAKMTVIEELNEVNSDIIAQKAVLNDEIPVLEKEFSELENTIPKFKIGYDVCLYKKMRHRTKELKEIMRFCRKNKVWDINQDAISTEVNFYSFILRV